MITVSLCMIVKDEEEVLARCLESVRGFVDEIIIVDTGSSDNTVNIAKKFTNKIYNFEWCDDFSKARNFAFEKASGTYLMWLDADDVVPKDSLNKLIAIKQSLKADVYMLKYDVAFCDEKPTFSFYRERLIKNCVQAKWCGAVHECIVPFGKVERLDISICHKKIKHGNPMRNLKIYQKLEKQRGLSPREQYYYGRELFDNKKYNKSLKILKRFVRSGDGWVENIIEAIYLIGKIYIQLDNFKDAKEWLFKTFIYDCPRANVCCLLGDIFLREKNFECAIFWFDVATKSKDVSFKGGFVEPMYYNYYPYLQLCYCNYCLGNLKLAEEYNLLASKFCLSDQVMHNIKFFESLKK